MRPSRRLGWPTVLACGAVILLTGCPKRVVLPPELGEIPSQQLLQQALQSAERHEALASPFKLKVTLAGRTDRLEGVLAIRWPAGGALHVRLELLGPLGPPLAYGVLRPDQALLYLPYSGNVALTSSNPTGLLQQGGLALDRVLVLLLGGALSCDTMSTPVRVQGRLETICETNASPDAAVNASGTPPSLGLSFHEHPLYLEGLTLTHTGDTPAQVTLIYGETTAGGGQGPVLGFRWKGTDTRITPGKDGAADMELELRLNAEEREYTLPDDPHLFHLDLPEGVQSGDLDAWVRAALSRP